MKDKLFFILIILLMLTLRLTAEKYLSIHLPVVAAINFNDVKIGDPYIIRWGNPNINWYMNQNGSDNLTITQAQTAVANAFNSWEQISTSTVDFTYLGLVADSYGYDPNGSNKNVIFWAEDGDPIYLTQSQGRHLALTYITVNSNQEIIDVDIVFTGKNIQVNGIDLIWKVDGNNFDVQAVATHEIGHLIGLAHTDVITNPKPTMDVYYQYNSPIEQRSLELDDFAGASFLYGGNLITDQTLIYTPRYFKWTININSGSTLTIPYGTEILFNSSTSLLVSGTLNSIGSFSNRIKLARSGTSGTWGGIQFNSGSSGNIQYCNIYNASNGIYAYNSSPTIKYCTLENNGTAVYSDYFSSPVLVGNNIRYNTNYGIRTNSYSSPNLTDNGYPGSNVIRDNGSNGLYSTYNCNPNLNGYMTNGNSVFNNSGYEVSALYNCIVYAERVYWGSCPPPEGEFYAYQSTINKNNCLSSNPNPGRVMIAGENNNQSLAPVINYSINEDEFGLAEEKQKEGKYEEAIGLYLEVFKKAMESSLGRLALIKIEECFTRSGRKNFFEFAVKELKPLIKDKPGLSVVLLELETHQEVIHGNIDKAMKNLDIIINKYNLDEYTDKYTLFRIGSFYIHFYSDVERAEKIFNQIISKYPNDPLIEEISFLMNTPVYKGQIESNTIIEVTDKVKEEYRIENYPNPFNPTTTIRYQIPQDGHISLKVYDMLGREVAELVNENKKAGEYTVNFDGSKLSSGVYIYKLVGNNVNISKKMILMK